MQHHGTFQAGAQVRDGGVQVAPLRGDRVLQGSFQLLVQGVQPGKERVKARSRAHPDQSQVILVADQARHRFVSAQRQCLVLFY